MVPDMHYRRPILEQVNAKRYLTQINDQKRAVFNTQTAAQLRSHIQALLSEH